MTVNTNESQKRLTLHTIHVIVRESGTVQTKSVPRGVSQVRLGALGVSIPQHADHHEPCTITRIIASLERPT
eukprot:1179024-Prorocentrum_minimum.AAC.4